jgi:signal transduction histidine kinase
MFRIKSFQRRILFALLAVGLIPSAILLLAGNQVVHSVVERVGTAGPWGSVAESGQNLLEQMDSAGITDPAVLAAAEAHREALSESFRFSQIVSFLGERILAFLPLVVIVVAVLIAGLAFWAARQLSRGFSRPIKDLVEWTEIIAHEEPLPTPGPKEARGVQEFAVLRDALRRMASELEEGRRQAVHSAKLRSWTEMARRVAHELKNPLTPMKMAAGRLIRLEDQGAREAAAVLLEEIDRLDEMARTFSQFGRMPEGVPSEIDLDELMRGLVDQHRSDGTDFHYERSPELPMVLGHYEALLRAYRNLLVNALEAAGPKGEVWIRAWQEGEAVKVEIRDSGPGIPEEDLDRIFDPEFTTKSSGTGLGLPMVQQTVRFHHGTLEARNHPQGGAVFLVELPLRGPKAHTGGEASSSTPGATLP